MVFTTYGETNLTTSNKIKKDDFIYRLIFTRMKDIFSQNALAYISKDKNKNCGQIYFLSQIKQTYTFEPYLNIGNDNHRKAFTMIYTTKEARIGGGVSMFPVPGVF